MEFLDCTPFPLFGVACCCPAGSISRQPPQPAAIQGAIHKKMEQFVGSIDAQGFCICGQISLADVHCCPILHRLDVGLAYYRQFSVRGTNPRIGDLLDTVTALPEFKAGLVSDEEIIANYEFPAHAAKWAADGAGFGGRGAGGGGAAGARI